MQDQMSGAAGAMPQDPKAAFKAEWEALEITEYQNALQNAETELLQLVTSGARNLNSIEHWTKHFVFQCAFQISMNKKH